METTERGYKTEQDAVSASLPGQIVADEGSNVYPRYWILNAPKVGDAVSYTFNGDYYPCGHIHSVSSEDKKFRIVKTTTGDIFYRRKNSASWIMKGGTWSLIQGHRSEMNPDF
jgi:hypothetical protein